MQEDLFLCPFFSFDFIKIVCYVCTKTVFDLKITLFFVAFFCLFLELCSWYFLMIKHALCVKEKKKRNSLLPLYPALFKPALFFSSYLSVFKLKVVASLFTLKFKNCLQCINSMYLSLKKIIKESLDCQLTGQ